MLWILGRSRQLYEITRKFLACPEEKQRTVPAHSLWKRHSLANCPKVAPRTCPRCHGVVHRPLGAQGARNLIHSCGLPVNGLWAVWWFLRRNAPRPPASHPSSVDLHGVPSRGHAARRQDPPSRAPARASMMRSRACRGAPQAGSAPGIDGLRLPRERSRRKGRAWPEGDPGRHRAARTLRGAGAALARASCVRSLLD